jgi:MFS transporter, DHA2 family, methylenomycin A resistance protein
MTAPGTATRTAWSAPAWAIYLGWVVITLDGSALNLALPTIASQLQAGTGAISWVVDAYTLPLASLLLLGGSLGDRVGAVRLFRIGALGFAATSIGCALSPSMGLLVGWRAAQGVCAAALLPMVLALVGKSFTDAVQRATAVNLMTVFGGAGMAFGPFLGGLLTDTVGWRAVFWLTAPVAIVSALLVGGLDGEGGRAAAFRVDAVGQLTGTAALVALVAGLIEVGKQSHAGLARLSLGLGAALLGVFVLVEHRSRRPIMPLRVFRSPGFSKAVAGGFAFQFGAYGLQFFLAVHLQSAWHISALTGGLLLASFPIGIVLASATLNPFLLRAGTRVMILTGASAAGTGSLALLLVQSRREWWLLVLAEFVIGTGTGVYSTALNKLASGSLGSDRAGLASGIYNTARQVGQCVGIAILGTLATVSDAGSGYRLAIALVTGCAVAIVATELPRGRAAAVAVERRPHSAPVAARARR